MTEQTVTEATTEAVQPPPAAAGEMKRMVHHNPSDLVIITDENHPLYDERVKMKLDADLLASVKEHGVLQPVMVVDGKSYDKPGKWIVIAGRQRTRAAAEANKGRKAEDRIDVPCTVWEANDKFFQTALLSENELRTNDTPVVRARKMRRYLDLGFNEQELATACGLSRTAVKNTLVVLDLTAEARKAVDNYQITLSDAAELAKLDPDKQRAAVEKMIRAGAGKAGHAKTKAKREALGDATGKVSRPSPKAVKAFFGDAKQSTDQKWKDHVDPLLKWLLGLRKTPPTIPGFKPKEDDAEE